MGYKAPLEVSMFFTVFGFMLSRSVNSNLLIYRTCYVLLHYNKTDCAKLGFITNNSTEALEKLVEPTSTYIALVRSIIESVVGSVLCLFIAPWSDRFGRKPVLIMGFVGGTIGMLLQTIFAAMENLSPWFTLVLMIPELATGGATSFMAIMSAYLADTTTKEKRALRMGIFDLFMALALLLGNAASSYLLIATNYVTVDCIATGCSLISLVSTIFFIPESLRERETENQVAGFFSITNLVEMLKVPFKRRENSRRAVLLLILASMFLGFLTSGSQQMFFYFLRGKLGWTLTQITWYGTATTILGIIGTIFVVYLLHTLLKIKEPLLIFVGSVFSVAASLTFGFAMKDWQIYFGNILGLPTAGQGTLLKSLISKIVHEEELAKILSTFTIGSSILGPVSSIMYTTMYNATINTDPALFNFLSAAICLCSSIIFLVVLVIQRNSSSETYAAFADEPDEDTESEPENTLASSYATVN